jgi:hypothetical protein
MATSAWGLQEVVWGCPNCKRHMRRHDIIKTSMKELLEMRRADHIRVCKDQVMYVLREM